VNRILNQLVPSFNFPQPSITDGTDVLRPATLRGLSPDQTLVLVNGKRRHPSALLNINGSVGRGSAAVDLNNIPPLAIDRIEVLRDGASSQYGSDAIAGVINVQLRRRPGGRFQVTYGRYHTSLEDVPEVTGVQRGATGEPVIDADGNFVLITGDRDRRARDGDTVTSAATYGFQIGEGGFLNLTGEYRNRESTNRAGYDPRRQYPLVGGRTPAAEFTFDRISHRYGDAETRDVTLFMNAGTELGADIEFYTFGSYNSRQGESAGFYRRAIDARNRNFSASSTTFVPFYPNGFLPLITSDIEDYSLAAGVRGQTGGWNWDLSHVYGHNGFDFGVANSFNTSFGAASQTVFDAGGLRFGQHVSNLDVQRPIALGFVKELSVALGAEYRHENFDIVAGDPQSYTAGPFASAPFNAPAGSQVFPGFRPANEVDAKRHSYAGYAELDADITDYLTVQVAGRYEDYSDFGNTVTGKLAARIAPVEWASLRGSISSGFRAPSLHQQFYSTTSTNNVNGVLVEIGTFPVSDPVARALGAQELEPEESVNFGLGATLTPGRFNLTVDYYQVEIDDRIVVTRTSRARRSSRCCGPRASTTSPRLVSSSTASIPAPGASMSWVPTGCPKRGSAISRSRPVTTATGRGSPTGRCSRPSRPDAVRPRRVTAHRAGPAAQQDQPRSRLGQRHLGLTARTNRYGAVRIAGSTLAADETLEPRWVTDLEVQRGGERNGTVRARAPTTFSTSTPRASRRRNLRRQPVLPALFELLAVRLQRPLPLRTNFRPVLMGPADGKGGFGPLFCAHLRGPAKPGNARLTSRPKPS
jgi:iron complex outermembrane receptor protein